MFQTHPVRMWMEYELPGFQKPLVSFTFSPNPIRIRVPKIPDTPLGCVEFFIAVEGTRII